MKTLKKYTQFIKESKQRSLDEIMVEFMERFHDEYDYEIDDDFINVYHVTDERGEPGDDFKDQIAADNAEAADELVKILANEGWGIWEYAPPTYKGFSITQIWDPPTYN